MKTKPLKKGKDKKHTDALPAKYVAFVNEYTVTWNAGLAARESGLATGSPSICSKTGTRALQDPRVRRAIVQETEIQAARLHITKERITHMLLQTWDAAVRRESLDAQTKIALALAKLHGLMFDRKQVVYTELAAMDEDQIQAFLGSSYDPKLLESLGGSVPVRAVTSSLPAPLSQVVDEEE